LPRTDPCGLGHSFDGKRLVQMFSVKKATGPTSSTASVAANKGEIFSLACVKLEPIGLTPTIGGE
jgi:hypothetical protein